MSTPSLEMTAADESLMETWAASVDPVNIVTPPQPLTPPPQTGNNDDDDETVSLPPTPACTEEPEDAGLLLAGDNTQQLPAPITPVQQPEEHEDAESESLLAGTYTAQQLPGTSTPQPERMEDEEIYELRRYVASVAVLRESMNEEVADVRRTTSSSDDEGGDPGSTGIRGVTTDRFRERVRAARTD